MNLLLASWYDAGLLKYLVEGGIFMWPILGCGVLALAVMIERWRSLKMLGTDTSKLRSKVRDMLHEDRIQEALDLCESQQGPVPAILAVGLRQFLLLREMGRDAAAIEEKVVKAMDDYGIHILAALERHVSILATIAGVAPMLGFLGTVQGMVVAFEEIVAKQGTANTVVLAASGIKIALLTTVFGLIVGIPTYIAYNYFTGVINRFVLEVEESASELIEAVTLRMALAEKVAEKLE